VRVPCFGINGSTMREGHGELEDRLFLLPSPPGIAARVGGKKHADLCVKTRILESAPGCLLLLRYFFSWIVLCTLPRVSNPRP
jgi:hypothetical protein